MQHSTFETFLASTQQIGGSLASQVERILAGGGCLRATVGLAQAARMAAHGAQALGAGQPYPAQAVQDLIVLKLAEAQRAWATPAGARSAAQYAALALTLDEWVSDLQGVEDVLAAPAQAAARGTLVALTAQACRQALLLVACARSQAA